MKQHRQSYLMNNDQRTNSNRANYIPTDFNNPSMTRTNNSYDIIQQQEQKLRFILFLILNRK